MVARLRWAGAHNYGKMLNIHISCRSTVVRMSRRQSTFDERAIQKSDTKARHCEVNKVKSRIRLCRQCVPGLTALVLSASACEACAPTLHVAINKCTGDDTKVAAHRSPNCIRKTKNKIRRKTIFNMEYGILSPRIVARGSGSWHWICQVAAPCNVARDFAMTCHWICHVTAPCNVACGSGIMTLNSPSGSTLQCDTWLLTFLTYERICKVKRFLVSICL